MAIAATVRINQESFRQANEIMAKFGQALNSYIIYKGLNAAGNVVSQQARTLAPDSRQTGTRNLWSKKVRGKRANTRSHKDTIGVSSPRNYGERKAIYVGPLYPGGNLINVIGHPHAQVLWGRRTGVTLPATDYLERAGKQTESAQQAAFVGAVQTESDKYLRKAASSVIRPRQLLLFT